MSEAVRGALVAITADQIAEDGTQWIEIMPTADKARNGQWYFTITRDDLEAYAESIRKNADRIPLDRDHETEAGGSTRAAGWFTGEAEVRDSDNGPRLWAQVKWTKSGRDDIENREFRYVSPVFSFQSKDEKTGLWTKAKDILRTALTNNPFFELAPVAAVVWSADEGLQRFQSLLNDALNPGGFAEARYWVMDVAVSRDKALVQEYAASKTWVVPFTIDAAGQAQPAPRAEWTEARQEWVTAATAALQNNTARRAFTERNDMPDTKILAKALGLPEDADDAAITAAIKAQADEKTALEAKVADLEKKVLPEDELKTLVAQAAEGATAAKELADMKVQTLLADAVRAGKILPAQKDALATMARADFDGVKAILDATPEKAFAEKGSGSEGHDGDAPVTAEMRDEFRSGDEEADKDSLTVHAAAVKILADAGKASSFTEDEYLAACAQAERDLATA